MTIIDGRLDVLNGYKVIVDSLMSNMATQDFVISKGRPLTRMMWVIMGFIVFWKMVFPFIKPLINEVVPVVLSIFYKYC